MQIRKRTVWLISQKNKAEEGLVSLNLSHQVEKKYGLNFTGGYFEYDRNLDESELEPLCTAAVRFDEEGIPAGLRIFIQDSDEKHALEEIIDALKADNFMDEQAKKAEPVRSALYKD
jgi:hypothetical protein